MKIYWSALLHRATIISTSLVASDGILPGNGDGLFLFWRFINLSLTYLLTQSLLTPGTHTGLVFYRDVAELEFESTHSFLQIQNLTYFKRHLCEIWIFGFQFGELFSPFIVLCQ